MYFFCITIALSHPEKAPFMLGVIQYFSSSKTCWRVVIDIILRQLPVEWKGEVVCREFEEGNWGGSLIMWHTRYVPPPTYMKKQSYNMCVKRKLILKVDYAFCRAVVLSKHFLQTLASNKMANSQVCNCDIFTSWQCSFNIFSQLCLRQEGWPCRWCFYLNCL